MKCLNTSEIHNYIFVKLNVDNIKEQNIDTYIQTLIKNLEDTNEFDNVVVIPITKQETNIKIIYQIFNTDGTISIEEIKI